VNFKMILKIIWSEEDKCEDVMEISNYYSEDDYLEAAIGKDMTSGDREIIVSEGLVMINVLPDAEGEDYWETIQVLSDSGFVLWETKNINLELIKQEQDVTA